jgi:plasmid stabilization system protein ParE
MARRIRKVVWTNTGQNTLDEAVAYIAKDSLSAALQLLETALDTAESLSLFSERGRTVPELQQPNIRELLVGKYRMIYERFDDRVEILGFIHGARDFAKWRESLPGDAG